MKTEARVVTQQRGPEYWRGLVAEQASGTQKVTAFCRERGLPVWKFSYWRKRMAGRDGKDGGFVRLRTPPGGGEIAIWIEAGACRVGVTPAFDASTLRRVVEALSRSC